MPEFNHDPEYKPNLDPKKDWGINNGNNNKASSKLQQLENNQNTNTAGDNEPLNEKESDLAVNPRNSNSANVPDWRNKVTKKALLKKGLLHKKGPIAVLASIILLGFVLVVVYMVPAGISFQIIEALTNFSDTSTQSLHIRSNLMSYNKMKNAFSESSDGKCNIKCKFGTVNEDFKTNLEKNGFEVEATKNKFGRYSIDSMKFPDGTTVNNAAEFKAALEDIPRASSFTKVFNPKSAFFLNSKFTSALKAKFGIDKLAKLTSEAKDKATGKLTKTKDNVKNALRKALGLPEIDVNAPKASMKDRLEADPKFKAAKEKVGKLSGKAGSITNIVGGVCSIYDVSKGVTFAIKTARIASFAAFAMIILNASDQAKAGDSDENVMSVVGDMLTQTDENGQTATSSLGYREAAYNETGTLSTEDAKYSSIISNTNVNTLAELTSIITASGIVGISLFNDLCKAANNPVIAAVLACPEDITAALITGGLAAIPGLAACALKSGVIMYAMSQAISKGVGTVTGNIAAAETPLLDETTRGAAVGNAIFSGSSQILGGKAATYGLKAGNKSQIRQYTAKVAAIKQQEEAIAAYEAKDSPFDVTNQYSFLGSIYKSLGISNIKNSSSATNLNNLFSFLPKSFAKLSNNTYAEANNKADLYDGKCTDANLAAVGVDGDVFCNPSYVMSDEELDADVNTVTQYMIDNKFINEDSGEAVKNTDYQLYLDNCANRVEPLGETSASIGDSDYAWKIGLNCNADSSTNIGKELSYFHTYTMDKSINDTMDKPYSNSDSTSETAGSTIDMAHLYEDSTNIACAAGTTDSGTADGYTDGQLVKIRVCAIPNTNDTDENLAAPRQMTVNSRVSGAFLNLVNDLLKSTGQTTLTINSSFRTPEMQQADVDRYGLWNGSSGAAAVGYGLHQMGIAIDYSTTTSDVVAKYGFQIPYSSEPWHIQP